MTKGMAFGVELEWGRRHRLAALLPAVLVAVLATPAHAAEGTRCGFATVIGIRGSEEPAGSGSSNDDRTYVSEGLGDVIRNFGIGIQSDPNISVYVEALKYPAVVADPGSSEATNYLASINIGAKNAILEIRDLARSCPKTNIILAGYSQGAEVIKKAITGTEYHGENYSLSSGDKTHLRSIVLFGAPSYHAGEPWNAAESGSSNGVFGATGNPYEDLRLPAWLPPSYSSQGKVSIVRSYCLSGDFFCQSNLTPEGMRIHGSYSNSSMMVDALSFVETWLTDND